MVSVNREGVITACKSTIIFNSIFNLVKPVPQRQQVDSAVKLG